MTTTRWKVDRWTNGQVCIISERGLICIMESGNDETRKADAEQIVREHNAHAALVEALEFYANRNHWMRQTEKSPEEMLLICYKNNGPDVPKDGWATAEAALRLAKGG